MKRDFLYYFTWMNIWAIKAIDLVQFTNEEKQLQLMVKISQ